MNRTNKAFTPGFVLIEPNGDNTPLITQKSHDLGLMFRMVLVTVQSPLHYTGVLRPT